MAVPLISPSMYLLPIPVMLMSFFFVVFVELVFTSFLDPLESSPPPPPSSPDPPEAAITPPPSLRRSVTRRGGVLLVATLTRLLKAPRFVVPDRALVVVDE